MFFLSPLPLTFSLSLGYRKPKFIFAICLFDLLVFLACWHGNPIQSSISSATNTQDVVTRTTKSSAKWILYIDRKWIFTVLVYRSDLKFRWWKQMNRKQENFTVGVPLWIVRSRVIWFDILGTRLSKTESSRLHGMEKFSISALRLVMSMVEQFDQMLSDREFYQMMQMKLINRLILWL